MRINTKIRNYDEAIDLEAKQYSGGDLVVVVFVGIAVKREDAGIGVLNDTPVDVRSDRVVEPYNIGIVDMSGVSSASWLTHTHAAQEKLPVELANDRRVNTETRAHGERVHADATAI